jgi:hypothetical protein
MERHRSIGFSEAEQATLISSISVIGGEILNRRDHLFHRGGITERFTHVGELVHVSGSKHETSAELERIFAQPVLPHSDGFGAFAGAGIVGAEQMQEVGVAQSQSAVGLALVINQKREGDSGLLAEVPGVAGVAESHGHDPGALLADGLLMFAQLRDVLAAEDSTPVAQKDHECRTVSPQ